MEQLCRVLPYDARIVNAVALDVADALSRDAARDAQGRIVATVNVYGNESRAAIEVRAADARHTRLCVSLLAPCPSLSREGRRRALSYIADSMEQLIENTFSGA